MQLTKKQYAELEEVIKEMIKNNTELKSFIGYAAFTTEIPNKEIDRLLKNIFEILSE